MSKQEKAMEIGVLARLPEDDSDPFAAVAGHGVRAAQLCNWNMALFTPEKAKRMKKLAKASGVRIAAVWAGYSGRNVWNFIEGPTTLGLVPEATRAQRVADLKRGADFAAACGAPAIVTHCGFIPENASDPLYPPTLAAIREVAEYCAGLGLGFWFETGQETPVTLLRVIEDLALPNLGINLDTANLILYGKGNPLDALDVFGSHVRNLHAKDGVYPTNGRELGKEVPVGEGKTNFKKLIPKLHALGFRGEIIIEREIEGDEQTRDIVKTVKLLRKLVGKIKK